MKFLGKSHIICFPIVTQNLGNGMPTMYLKTYFRFYDTI